jgi:outer membrane protein assembly factor BamB
LSFLFALVWLLLTSAPVIERGECGEPTLGDHSPRANWPCWRGASRGGVSPEKDLPVTWSATENVRWKTAIPGAGVSAPIVWQERVLVTSSTGRSGEQLHLFCLHRDTGKVLWERRFFGSAVPEGRFPPGGMAVPTPATDGKRIFALYGTGDLVCVDMEGKPVWVRSLADEYGIFRNRWGMAASPLLLDGLLVIQVDHWGKSYLLGVDPATGRNRWRTMRDAAVNWSSPVAVRFEGRTQIIAAGTYLLEGYDAETGEKLWGVRGMMQQCIPTPVVRGERIYLVSGQTFTSLCVRLEKDDKGKPAARVEWKVPSKGTGIPSPLCIGDHYYYAEDAGWAACLSAADGKPVWRRRLSGKVQASPVGGDGKLYFTGVNGTVTVLRAGAKFAVLGRNEIGESIVASPALSQGCIFLRGEKHLFCVAGKGVGR